MEGYICRRGFSTIKALSLSLSLSLGGIGIRIGLSSLLGFVSGSSQGAAAAAVMVIQLSFRTTNNPE